MTDWPRVSSAEARCWKRWGWGVRWWQAWWGCRRFPAGSFLPQTQQSVQTPHMPPTAAFPRARCLSGQTSTVPTWTQLRWEWRPVCQPATCHFPQATCSVHMWPQPTRQQGHTMTEISVPVQPHPQGTTTGTRCSQWGNRRCLSTSAAHHVSSSGPAL